MKNAVLKKLFAIVLVITMCVSLLPVSAAAEEPADDAEQTEKVVYQADQEPAEEEGQADEEEKEDEQPDEGETSETVRVVFVCDPAKTEVTVYDAEGAEITPEEDGSYLLVPGSYTYSASCEGYVSDEDIEFVIKSGAEGSEIVVSLQAVQESDGNGTDSDVPAAQAEIKITAPKTELEVGETMQLEVVCENESTDLSSAAWSSSDEEILIVDETGLVTAVGEGEAKVCVSDSASKLSADIVIRVNIAQTNPAISTFAATPPVLTSFTPIWPVTTTKRINALDHYSNGDSHRGIDINAGRESVVYAVADGVVAETNNTCSHDSDTSDTCGYSWGNYVLIKHNVNGTIYYSRYAHLTKDSIPSDIYPGASVACNQEIGKSGSSGSSSGPHLHLELYTGNRSENAPKSFQYYTGNSTVLDGMSFSSHIPTSSVYFGDWVSSNCILSNGIYVYNGSPADDIIATGTCGAEGDNLKWTLDKDGVLTISGSGEMADYAIAGKKESSAPWSDEASQIKSVVIESGVTSIGHYAFFYCTELASVSIPDGVTSIQGYAFYGCTGLTSLTLPASVEDIGTAGDFTLEGSGISSFVWESGITSINIDPANAVFTSIDGVMYNKAKTKLLSCPPGRTGSFSIPSGVTEIADDSLYSCAKLTNVDIPNTVTRISGGAFAGCRGLTRVTIPESVTEIEGWSFQQCLNLKEIEFCHSATAPLEFILIPYDGIKVFWQDLYDTIETTVVVRNKDAINPAISGYDWAGDNRSVTFKSRDDGSASDIIASGTCGAEGDNLKWTLDKNGVLTISGTGAMMDYADNEGFIMPQPWESYAAQIKEVIIADGVTTIGACAFRGCAELTHLSIPASVTGMGGSYDDTAFSYCNNIVRGCFKLSAIDVDSTNTKFTSKDGVVYSKDFLEILIYPQGKTGDFVIPDGITKIGENAFNGSDGSGSVTQRGLTKVTIPNTVMSIGSGAFGYCTELTQLVIPKSVSSIEEGAFQNCTGLTQLTIPEGVTSIGPRAFSGCDNLKEIEFCQVAGAMLIFTGPTGVSPNAFYSNTKIATTIKVPDVNDINTSISKYDWAGDNRTVTYVAQSGTPRHAPNMYVDWITNNEYDVISVDWYCEEDADNTYWAVHNWDGGYAGFQTQENGKHVLLMSLWDLEDGTSPKIEYVLDGKNGSFGGEGTGKQVFTNYDWKVGKWYSMCIQVSSDDSKSYYTQYVKEEGGEWLKTAVISYPVTGKSFYGSSVFQEDYAFNNLMRSCRLRNASGRISSTGEWESWNACRVSNSFFPTDEASWESGVQLNINFDCDFENYNDYVWVQSGGKGFESNGKQVPAEYTLNNSSIPAKTLFDDQDEPSDDIVASGTCGTEGDNLKWALDKDGVLTISGTGAMADFGSAMPQPWESYNAQIKTIVIENGAATIGIAAFAGCTSLSAVTIPDSVTSIGMSAFASCTSLTRVTIPASVTRIGNAVWNIFRGCSALTDIDVDPQNQSFTAKDGVLYDKAMETLLVCPEGKTGELVIPDGVKIVGSMAAIGCGKLTGVKLPDSMTTIGFHAFENCTGLTKLTVPESVTSIGFCAFAYCDKLKEIEFCHSAKAALKFEGVEDLEPNSFYSAITTTIATTIIVPDADNINPAISGYDWANDCRTVTYKSREGGSSDGIIASGFCGAEGDNLKWTLDKNGVLTISGTGAMMDGYSYIEDTVISLPWESYTAQIKNIVIGDGVTTIGKGAFAGCSSLSAVTIPDSMTLIDATAFADCTSLTRVTIPASVTRIGNAVWNVFEGCSALTAIDADPQNQSFASKDGILYDKTMERLLVCPGGKTGVLMIPDGVKIVGSLAAIGCDKLTGVKLPDSMTDIGFHAFQNCTGLTQLTIPESVTSIGFCAFSGCDKLKEIEFCHSAEAALKIESIEGHGSYAFYSSTKLATTIKVPDADNINPAISGYDWKRDNRTVAYSSSDGIIASGECGAEGDNLKWTLDKDGVLTISGTGAMEDFEASTTGELRPWDSYAAQVKEVVIAEGVTTIGRWAFSYLVLDTDDEANFLYSSNNHAYPQYINLTKLTIADSVTIIGAYAFDQCPGLTSVTIPCNVKEIGRGAFSNYYVTDISVDEANQYYVSENGVLYDKAKTELIMCLSSKAGAFSIPDGVEIIKGDAFSCCDKLTAIEIPSSVTTIEGCAFSSCDGLKSMIIPNGVTTIGNWAFLACSELERLSIPASVTTIGRDIVQTCFKLSAIDVDSANAKFASKDGVVYSKDMTELLIYPQGKTGDFVIPDGVVKIGKAAFIGYDGTGRTTTKRGLTKVTIPSSVKSIGSEAFEGCNELTQLTIPASVTSIGSYAFVDCDKLKEIEFCHSAGANLTFEETYSGYTPRVFHNRTQLATTIIVPDADNINPAISGYDWKGDNRTVTYKAADKPADDGTEIKLDELATDQAGSGGLVRIDVGGTVYTIDENGSFGSVEIAENKAVFAAVSGYNTTGGTDPHSQYPTGMEVYLLYNDNGTAKAKRIPEFDDLLRYSGCSIRITGNKGIRMITSVDGALKASLINGSVAGYTLEEYGTLLCFSSEMVNGSLCLEDSYARHNYAYSRAAGTDPVFKYVGSTIQYTNVLVGFDLKQCADDIAMRPYIVLSDESGNRFTIYGGIVQRSIGYIAYQNRSAFASDDPAYDYIWDIIHHVYGDKYDADYKK